jgi:hypothetical protein
MNKVIPIVICAVIVMLIGITVFVSDFVPTESQIEQKEHTSTYLTLNGLIKAKLESQQIQMSSPIKLSKQDDLQKYCSFFTDPTKQDLVQYCTSTELKDINDAFLGNIHMVGSPDEPKIILALVQVNQTMGQIDSVKTIFDATIRSVVCDCWEQQKPGGLENIGQWVDGLQQFHQSDNKPHSKSNELILDGKTIQMELSQNKDGFLWQFFIYD